MDSVSKIILNSALGYAGGYLLGLGSGKEHLGGAITLISIIAHTALNYATTTYILESSRKVSQIFLARALTNVVVGTATIAVLVANKLLSDGGIAIFGVYYGLCTAIDLIRAIRFRNSTLPDKLQMV